MPRCMSHLCLSHVLQLKVPNESQSASFAGKPTLCLPIRVPNDGAVRIRPTSHLMSSNVGFLRTHISFQANATCCILDTKNIGLWREVVQNNTTGLVMPEGESQTEPVLQRGWTDVFCFVIQLVEFKCCSLPKVQAHPSQVFLYAMRVGFVLAGIESEACGSPAEIDHLFSLTSPLCWDEC